MSCNGFIPSPPEGIGDGNKAFPFFSNVVYFPRRKSASVLTYERQKEAREEVQRAVAANRFFTIQGPYHAVREGLRRRGWVEKFYLFSIYRNRFAENQNNEDGEMTDGDGNRIHLEDHGSTVPPWKEDAGYYGLMSRLVQKYEPVFFWGVRRDVFDPKLLKPNQLVNHFARAVFTSKVGLCRYLHELPWFEQNCSKTFYPRSYQLAKADEKDAFEEDFCLTACVSLLKILKESFLSTKSLDDDKESGKYLVVSEKILTQALKVCRRYLSSTIHEDIDEPSTIFWIGHYEELLDVYYQARKFPGSVLCSDMNNASLEIEVILQEISQKCPQFEIDGTRDVWIVKPGAKSRGRGIQCFDDLKEILKLVENGSCISEKKYVIQKYIEKPLLIYKTKFDIRQWFLVTDWNPLTLWFYKDCYLRFCSQEFTLDDFCLSIHLSNNSIQKNFKNGARSTKLPDDNMWTCHRFKSFLSENGAPEGVWDQIIYDGMKKAIVWSLLCCQEVVEHRKNTFELYGADFMLSENYQPWLIEINASPCMAASTSVTAYMCPRVLEDTLKVVLDKNGDTGLFELAYKQQQVTVPALLGLNLKVCGQPILRPPTTSQSVRADNRRIVGLKSRNFQTINRIVSNNNGKRNSFYRRPWRNYENVSNFSRSRSSSLASASLTTWSIDSDDDVRIKSKHKKRKSKRKKTRKCSSLMKKESGKCQVCFRNGRIRCVCSKGLDLRISNKEEFESLPNLRGFKALFPSKQTCSTDCFSDVRKENSKEPLSSPLSSPLPSLEFLKTPREDKVNLRVAGKTLSTLSPGFSYLRACHEISTFSDNCPRAWSSRYRSASIRKPLRSCSKERMAGLQKCVSAKSSVPVGNWTAFPAIGQRPSIFGQLSSSNLSVNRVENDNLVERLTNTTSRRIVKSSQRKVSRQPFNSGKSLAQLVDQLTLRPFVQRLKPLQNFNAEDKKCGQTASS